MCSDGHGEGNLDGKPYGWEDAVSRVCASVVFTLYSDEKICRLLTYDGSCEAEVSRRPVKAAS